MTEPRAPAGRQHPALPHAGEPSDPDRCRRPRHVVLRRPGRDLAPVRRLGPNGCLRHVVITSHLVSFGTSEVRYDGPMCGLPITIARNGTFIYVVAARGSTASIVFVGGGYTERFIDDHALLSLSTRGDFLVTPFRDPARARPGPPQGLQLYYRLPDRRAGPVPFGREASAAPGGRVPDAGPGTREMRTCWAAIAASAVSTASRWPRGRSAGARARRPDRRGHRRGDRHRRRQT